MHATQRSPKLSQPADFQPGEWSRNLKTTNSAFWASVAQTHFSNISKKNVALKSLRDRIVLHHAEKMTCRKNGYYYRSLILFHEKVASGTAWLNSNWERESVLKFRYGFKNRCNYFPSLNKYLQSSYHVPGTVPKQI